MGPPNESTASLGSVAVLRRDFKHPSAPPVDEEWRGRVRGGQTVTK